MNKKDKHRTKVAITTISVIALLIIAGVVALIINNSGNKIPVYDEDGNIVGYAGFSMLSRVRVRTPQALKIQTRVSSVPTPSKTRVSSVFKPTAVAKAHLAEPKKEKCVLFDDYISLIGGKIRDPLPHHIGLGRYPLTARDFKSVWGPLPTEKGLGLGGSKGYGIKTIKMDGKGEIVLRNMQDKSEQVSFFSSMIAYLIRINGVHADSWPTSSTHLYIDANSFQDDSIGVIFDVESVSFTTHPNITESDVRRMKVGDSVIVSHGSYGNIYDKGYITMKLKKIHNTNTRKGAQFEFCRYGVPKEEPKKQQPVIYN